MTPSAYRIAGPWLKGNTHIHSTISDGGKNFVELAGMYAARGYDFLFRTDHWAASDVRADSQSYPLLWLDGVELDGTDPQGDWYHVLCLGTFTGLQREMGLVPALEAARAQGGLTILAHPYWSGNTPDAVRRWNFDGVEVYNHVCQWMNGKGYGGVHWHAALAQNPRTLALSSDDAHITADHPGWDGGWVKVNAPERTPSAILDAIRVGRFYSTRGPDFVSIERSDGQVAVQTSPVRFIRLVGGGVRGRRVGTFRGRLLTKAEFAIPPEWNYAYIEIEDNRGRCAWTNPV